ncbi:MAG: SCP2 sterol-binding domain-containing protein [Proteobacteria bacterium]|nr:SCP2 sterol-binding domain-containing protein [Pseudomonadota bacterium]
MAQFLSDSWFNEVDALRAAAGDIPVPEMVKDLVINILVKDHPEGDKEIHMNGGDFKRGAADDAPTKITVPYEVAKALFIDGNQEVGMQAFMSGQIQVEGDMSKMMQLQMAGPPSEEAKALQEKVKAITEA